MVLLAKNIAIILLNIQGRLIASIAINDVTLDSHLWQGFSYRFVISVDNLSYFVRWSYCGIQSNIPVVSNRVNFQISFHSYIVFFSLNKKKHNEVKKNLLV